MDIKLNGCQSKAMDAMIEFVENSTDRVFILNGYAGTGKTTLMRFLIKYLSDNERSYKLLSTTGRAAKILSNYTNDEARTIHSMIYSYKDLNKDLSGINADTINVDESGQLFLVFEPATVESENENGVVYIVDESSMISDTKATQIVQAQFGSGRLLTELLDYDKSPNSKFVFVGDPCQLPPIEGGFSPALDKNYIKTTFGVGVSEATLTQIMRQSDGNTIVDASKILRNSWSDAPDSVDAYIGTRNVWGLLKIRNYPDIHLTSDLSQMLDDYVENVKANGFNDSVFICRSNADCYKISATVRSRLGFSGNVTEGDLLMVVQNQYSTGLMNGDMVIVEKVGKNVEHAISTTNSKGYQTQLAFRELQVRELFTGRVYTTLVIENMLSMMQNNLDSRMQTGLFLDFVIRMKRNGITQKKMSLFKTCMMQDPYLNALRCSYGYAVTCHKAQGGEWNNVYIHLGTRNFTLNPTKATYQWMYTAITRSKKTVYLVDDFYIQ